MTEPLVALVEQWRKEADELDADGDFCCALIRRHDADTLDVVKNIVHSTLLWYENDRKHIDAENAQLTGQIRTLKAQSASLRALAQAVQVYDVQGSVTSALQVVEAARQVIPARPPEP